MKSPKMPGTGTDTNSVNLATEVKLDQSPDRNAESTRILQQRVRLLYAGLPASSIANIINACLLVIVLWPVTDQTVLVTWLFIIVGITAARVTLNIAYKKAPENSALWGDRFFIGIIVAGIAWGIGALLIFPSDSAAYQAFVAMVLAGMCAGGVSTLSPDLRAIQLFLLMLMIPISIRFFAEQTDIGIAMGIMGILFLVMLMISSRRFHSNIVQNIQLGIKNTERERALKSSDETSRALIDGTQEFLILIDRKGVVQIINEIGAKLLANSKPDELIGENVYKVLPAKMAANMRINIETAFSNGMPLQCEETNANSSFSISLFPILSEGDVSDRIVIFAHDITEQKKAEDELKLIATAFNSQEAIAITDQNANILRVNQAFTRITGYSAEEVIGNNPRLLKSGRHDDSFYQNMWQSLSDNAHWEGEIWNQKKNGDIYPEWLSITAVTNSAGQLVNYVAHFVDISERIEVMQALRDAEERTRLLLDSAAEGIYGLDTDGRTTFVNPAAAQLLGYSAEELVGQPMHSLVHHSYPDGSPYPREQCPMYAAFTDGDLLHVTNEVLWRKDGSSFPVEYTSTPVRKKGELAGAVVTFNDITLRRKAADELNRQRQVLQTVVDNVRAVLAMRDRQGRYVLVNRFFEESFNVSAKQAIGSTQTEVLPLAHAEAAERADEQVMSSGQMSTFEEHISHRDGTTHYYLTSLIPMFDDTGEVSGLVGLSTDITEQKETEQALAEAKGEAEQANRFKSEFLANMSHEIRTPMNAIIGLSQLALRTKLNPQQQDYLDKIAGSSNSLLNIINDILDFSKIEAGKLKLETVPFTLDECLDNLSNFIGLKAAEKEIELLYDVNSEVPQVLLGDPVRVGQILLNLVGNALKFTERGEIQVRINVKERTDSQVQIAFSVRDTGIGISLDQQETLFKSFTQADTSITRRFGGTGLGLTISKQLVEMMDGEISLESEQGQGSKFRFTATFGLPENVAEQARTTPKDMRGMRVMVVDDNDMARTILCNMVNSLSFQAVEAACGKDAIKLLKTSPDPFDLILLDWRMPGMDGIETARRLKKTAGSESMPTTILLTTFGQSTVAEAAEKAGIKRLLIKPLNASLLFDAIMDLFHRDQAIIAGRPKQESGKIRGLDSIRGAKILLAEDNRINQQIAKEMLELEGFIVQIANNGIEAVQAVQSNSFDALLMDIQMPEMDGLTATAVIRKSAKSEKLPIIAMTAHAMAGDKEKSLAAGMNDHLTKPIDQQKLYEVLVRWVSPGRKTTAKRKAVSPPEKEDSNLPDTMPGIDVAAGVQMLGDNPALFRRVLQQVHDDYSQVWEELTILQEKPDDEHALSRLHTLKGVVGNIRAHELHRVIGELEHSLLQSGFANNVQFDQCQKALATVIEAIARLPSIEAIDGKSKSDDTHLDLTHAECLLRQARDVLEANDLLDNGVVGELQDCLQGLPIADELTGLQNQIEQFNYEGALAQIAVLENALNLEIEGHKQ